MRGLRQRVTSHLLAAFVCVALLPTAAFATTASKPALSVPAATLVTIDGQQLWSNHKDTRRRVASTIKMLTALVVRERTSLDDTVTVTAKAAATEDGVGLVKGQKLSVRKLLQLMLVASANDAAEALAIHVSGSEKKFVALMNAKAKKLGLSRTHAVDPHGLSKREQSTARDLAVLGRKVMADSALRKMVLMQSVVLKRPNRAPKTIAATNELLGHYRGMEGVKTGFTYAAGYCLVGAAKRGKLEIVGVVLGARSKAARFSQMRKLLDWGFARYRFARIVSTATTMGVVQISDGTTSSVTVHAARDVSRAVLATGAPLSTEIILPHTLPAPIRRGDQLGVVRVTQAGTSLASVALLADSHVATVAPVPTAVPVASEPSVAPSVWERIRRLPSRVWFALTAGLMWGRTAGSS